MKKCYCCGKKYADHQIWKDRILCGNCYEDYLRAVEEFIGKFETEGDANKQEDIESCECHTIRDILLRGREVCE